MFDVDAVKTQSSQDSSQTNKTLYFGKGGFQGARGGSGEEFYIENIMDELDYPNEWYFNQSTNILYYFSNTSVFPKNNDDDYDDDLVFEVPVNKVLFKLNGTVDNPITDVVFDGITFRDTVYTYMDGHGVPSGGDWSLQYTASLILSNTREIVIKNCLFTKLDGNGIMLRGYNRNVTIYHNEFSWIGDSGITLWGITVGIDLSYLYKDNSITNNTSGVSVDSNVILTDGFDEGNKQEQPRFIHIIENIGHELGIWKKQSSFFFSAKSCENIVAYNIGYNVPKASIEFNDGFGGNSKIYKNLLFNNVRENVGHGPINSWDRQLYKFTTIGGTPQDNNYAGFLNYNMDYKQYDLIFKNFVLANYGSEWAIDNDDGSNWYHSFNNFLIYANNGLKSNAGGYNNIHNNNIYAYNEEYCWNIHTAPNNDHLNYYYNNTCVIDVDLDISNITYNKTNVYNYIWNEECNIIPSNLGIRAYNNSIYIKGATMDIIGMCGNISENVLQNVWKNDNNTVVYDNWPNENFLLTLARQLIF